MHYYHWCGYSQAKFYVIWANRFWARACDTFSCENLRILAKNAVLLTFNVYLSTDGNHILYTNKIIYLLFVGMLCFFLCQLILRFLAPMLYRVVKIAFFKNDLCDLDLWEKWKLRTTCIIYGMSLANIPSFMEIGQMINALELSTHCYWPIFQFHENKLRLTL